MAAVEVLMVQEIETEIQEALVAVAAEAVVQVVRPVQQLSQAQIQEYQMLLNMVTAAEVIIIDHLMLVAAVAVPAAAELQAVVVLPALAALEEVHQ